MKKIFRYVLVAMMATASVSMVSCTKDDDGDASVVVSQEDLVGTWAYNLEGSYADIKMNGIAISEEQAGNLNFMNELAGDITFGADNSFSGVTDGDEFKGSYALDNGQLTIVREYLGEQLTLGKGCDLKKIILSSDSSSASYLDMMDLEMKDLSVKINGDKLYLTVNFEGSLNGTPELGDEANDILGGLACDLISGLGVTAKIVSAYDRK